MNIIDALNIDKPYLAVVDNLITRAECNLLINLAKNKQIRTVRTSESIYNVSHMVDNEFAKLLFIRLLKTGILPDDIRGYKINRVSDVFTFYEYIESEESNDEFKILYKDGFKVDKFGNHSAITLVINLNKDFVGGYISFIEEDMKNVREIINPEIGRAILYDSQQYYNLSRVIANKKYIMVTDIMIKTT